MPGRGRLTVRVARSALGLADPAEILIAGGKSANLERSKTGVMPFSIRIQRDIPATSDDPSVKMYTFLPLVYLFKALRAARF